MTGNGDDAVALVTGGYKNLGYYISTELKQAGYNVVATYRSDHKEAESTARKLRIPVYLADMTNRDEVVDLFSRITSNDGRVGILVNNVSSFPKGPLQKMSDEEFENAFRSSVFSSNMAINQALLPMMDLGWGRIVNIGMAGVTEIKAYSDVAAHAAAKTAMAVLTRSWARELKEDNITVNMVSPGIIDYPGKDDAWRRKMKSISTSGKLTPPSNVSRAIRSLVERGDVTGRIIKVDPEFLGSDL